MITIKFVFRSETPHRQACLHGLRAAFTGLGDAPRCPAMFAANGSDDVFEARERVTVRERIASKEPSAYNFRK